MSIRAVFFDMGGTIDTYRYTRELRLKRTAEIQRRLLSAGIDLGLRNEALYEVVSKGLARYHAWSLSSQQELPPGTVWGDYILPEYPLVRQTLDGIAEDLMCYIETQYYERAMRPEIPTVLHSIQQMGLKIGLISNVNSRGQVPTSLAAYQIGSYFDPVVLSSEYGWRKPDPAIFHYAARLAKVPTSQCVYVGDRIARDVVGSRRAGFHRVVQIRHDFQHGELDEGATPDNVIENMLELLDILKAEINGTSSSWQRVGAQQSPVRALLFDAGDMLYYRPERGRYFREFLEGLGISPEERYNDEGSSLRQQAYCGEINQQDYHREILTLYGITQPDLAAQGLLAMQKDENNVQFFAGVRETLHSLKAKGFLLGIITDTANSLHTKLTWFERGGFGEVWDSITSSLDVGVRKPDPRIYYAALEQLGVRVEQAVFLGHKRSELEGARAIGMKTIAYNYDDDAPADFYIQEFADILNVPLLAYELEIRSSG